MIYISNSLTCLIILFLPLISSKGIILYGKGKVASGKKGATSTGQDEQNETVDGRFQFALFTPTTKIGTPSESFKNFTHQAISATLAGHGRQRVYYFMQDKRSYETAWMSDWNVCKSEVKSWQLHPHGGFLFADSEQQVTVYFICDQYCCATQCCDINVIFVVFIVFFALIGLAIPTWLCCRYGRRYFHRPKELDDDEFVDALDYFQTSDLPRQPSPTRSRRTRSLPLKVYNDDVRL